MAINSLSTGFRPGVCTSSTRPTAPYEGQVIYETDTDLSYVWGGSAWQQVSGGTAVGNSGLVYVASSTLTTNTQINNCFTSAYVNYRIVVSVDTHSGGASNIGGQLSTGGTPYTTTANYYYAGSEQQYNGGGVVTFSNNGANAFWVLGRLNGNDSACFTFDVLNPQVAVKKFYQNNYNDTGYFGRIGGLLNATNSFDGIKIYHLAGHTIGGTVRIYGYRQA